MPKCKAMPGRRRQCVKVRESHNTSSAKPQGLTTRASAARATKNISTPHHLNQPPVMPFCLADRVQATARLTAVTGTTAAIATTVAQPLAAAAAAAAAAPARRPSRPFAPRGRKDKTGAWFWKCPDCGPRAECTGLSTNSLSPAASAAAPACLLKPPVSRGGACRSMSVL